jgi:uncharacterized protein
MTEETHTTFPNKFEAFYIVAVLITVEIIVSLVIRQTDLFQDIEWHGISGFVAVVANGLVFSILLTYKKLSYRDLFHSASDSVANKLTRLSLPIVMIVPGLVTLTGALNLIVMWFIPMSRDDIERFREMQQLDVIPVFFACIAAPFLEEMLFRGVILRSFLQQYTRLQALLWSALIFGLAHLNAYQFFTAFVLGLVLGWLYERTRSLWPSIFLHAAFNSYVTYIGNSGPSASPESAIGLLGIAFGGAILGGYVLLRTLEPK